MSNNSPAPALHVFTELNTQKGKVVSISVQTSERLVVRFVTVKYLQVTKPEQDIYPIIDIPHGCAAPDVKQLNRMKKIANDIFAILDSKGHVSSQNYVWFEDDAVLTCVICPPDKEEPDERAARLLAFAIMKSLEVKSVLYTPFSIDWRVLKTA